MNIPEQLERKQQNLKDIRRVRKGGVFKNSDLEIAKIENQLIGEIQILNQLNNEQRSA